MEFKHISVLLKESIEGLNISPSGIYLDCTLGGAGHSFEIVKKLDDKGVLIGFDKDLDAIKESFKKLSKIAEVFIYNSSLQSFENTSRKFFNFSEIVSLERKKPVCLLFNDDFKSSPTILKKMGVYSLNGILMDLGVSSYQINSASRGFSFRLDSPLDMRMDQNKDFTAKDIVNGYSEEELTNLFYKYGEEEFAKSISKNIIKARQEKHIDTTKELNDLVEKSMPTKVVFSRRGAAKKVFQALRIEVNKELTGLDAFLKEIVSLLSINARICVISFHSLEDRIIKETFNSLSLNCVCPAFFPKCMCDHRAELKIITKKPVVASAKERSSNSRSSSAKLRIAEKIV